MIMTCLMRGLAVSAAAASSSDSPPSKPRGASPTPSDFNQHNQQHNQQHYQQQQYTPPSLSEDDAAIIRQLVQDLTTRMKETSALAGRFSRLRRNMSRVVSKQELYLVWKCISEATSISYKDVILLTMLGYLLVPAVKLIMPLPPSENVASGAASEYAYSNIDHVSFEPTQQQLQQDYNDDSLSKLQQDRKLPLAILIARYIQQLAQIALVVHAIDFVQMLAIGLGYVDTVSASTLTRSPSQFVCTTLYAAWVTRKTSLLAQWYVRRRFLQRLLNTDNYSHEKQRQRPMDLLASLRLEQVASMFVYATAAFGWLFWSVTAMPPMTALLVPNSLTAAVVLGTIFIGLLGAVSLHEVLQQIWSGIMLATSDRIRQGDVVQLVVGSSDEDATTFQGVVERIGWTDTTICGTDNRLVSIPNQELGRQFVNNLSRASFSHVHQTLRFNQKDAYKLPALMKAIKDEIRLACPTVIADESLQAHWTNLKEDHLVVDVHAHFHIAPTMTQECLDNRQRVLMAIHRAVKIHQVDYYSALPAAARTTQQTAALGPGGIVGGGSAFAGRSSSIQQQQLHYTSHSTRNHNGKTGSAGISSP
ncbi:hypothetical protein MPSEU_000044700 [Mayamaea pseudoterrestris]|nr:hypothetical protein MPSEU_000044700 [Mayamaea pseudoterrestris]